MELTASCNWKSELNFEAEVGEIKFPISGMTKEDGSAQGLTPKPLLLVSLSGCTALDVISILMKMHHNPAFFSVEAKGEIAETHPKKFLSIHLIYHCSSEVPQSALEKAITLSIEKYCGVYATLISAVPITWEIKYEN